MALSVKDLITDDRGFDSAPYAPEVQELIEQYDSIAQLDKALRSESQENELRALSRELARLEVDP